MKKILTILLFANLVFAKGIVILDPASVEIMYMLNAQDQIAAISKTATTKIWPEDKTDKLPSVGTYVKPNLEKIVELDPDVVLVSFHSSGVIDDLKRFNIKYESMQTDVIEDILKNVKRIAELTGKEKEGDELIKSFRDKLSKIDKERLKGKKAIAFFATTPLMAFGSKTLPGDIFELMGLDNLASDLTGNTPIATNEFLVSQNPEFIVVISSGNVDEFLSQNPILKNTDAIKNNKIFFISAASLMRGSPRIISEIEKIYEEFIK